MFSNTLKIAIAGIGTVGQGLLDLIKKSKLKHITNAKLEISAIASRRKKKFTGSGSRKKFLPDPDPEKIFTGSGSEKNFFYRIRIRFLYPDPDPAGSKIPGSGTTLH